MSDIDKRKAAEAAIAEISPGLRIGLGTGSTAWHFVDLLGDRVAEGFECLCVPTSEATARQARERNIPLSTLDELDHLDVTVDGADEIDPDLNLIKGAGGALLREKIVADASDRMIVIADGSKLVSTLGRFPLPVEVNIFGLGVTRGRVEAIMRDYGAEGGLSLRSSTAGESFVTDGGHFVLDASFGRISDAKALSNALLQVPGVVQHGLFIDMCDTAFVAGAEGVRRLGR